MKEETQYDFYEILAGEIIHTIRFEAPTEIKLDWSNGQVTIQKSNDCTNRKIYAVFNKDINIIKQAK